MKKTTALILAGLLFLCRLATAEDELYTFAGIPADTPYEQMKEALESATHLTFTDDETYVTSAAEPPIKYLDMPVHRISAEKSEQYNLSWINIYLKPYEVDMYTDQTWNFFDNDQYLQLRKNIHERYGTKGRMFVTFAAQGRKDMYRIENTAELMYIIEDTATWMMRNAYENAKIEIIRKNLIEGYLFTNLSDPSLYGNISVSSVYPLFQFFPVDMEASIDLTTYMSIQAFPVLKGVILYRNSF